MKALLVLILSTTAFAQSAHYRYDGRIALPDSKATPGAADPSMTAAKLCAKAFHTRDERDVTDSTKKRICLAYGITKGCPGPGFEIDHLVSLEIGGANSDQNLWPQPLDTASVPGFHTKDKLENALHREVCAGQMTLTAAQTCIRGDWWKCLQKQSSALKSPPAAKPPHASRH